MKRTELIAEPLENLHAVLVIEVRRTDGAPFELQHEFPDHPFFIGGAVGAAQRKNAVANSGAIGLPGVQILHVDSIDVPERGDAQSRQIRTLPKTVTVHKAGT